MIDLRNKTYQFDIVKPHWHWLYLRIVWTLVANVSTVTLVNWLKSKRL